MPGWVEWAGPLVFLVGSATILGLVPLASVQAAVRRLDPNAHWTEQARVAQSARASVVWAVVTVPAGIWMLSTVTIGPAGWLPAWIFGVMGAATAVLVVARVSWWVEGSLLDQPLPGWSRYLVGFLVRLVPVVAVIVLAIVAPARLSSPWMGLWVLLGLSVAVSLRFQLELLAGFGLARPADEQLTALVGRAASRVGLEMPAVFVIQHHRPNAYALPRRAAVAFTTRALTTLSDDELEAVALHELGHLAESPSLSRIRLMANFVWVPVAAIKPILGSFGSVGLLSLVAILFGLLILIRRFAAGMETRSDAHAITNLDESAVFGRALEIIYRIGLIPAVLRRSTHGQLHERLEAAGLAVDFDPPAPPSMRVLGASTVAGVIVGLVIFLAPYIATVGADLSSPVPAQVALTLGSYGSWPFERLGQLANARSDYQAAELFFAAAAEQTSDPDPLVDLVYVRSVLGRCTEAQAAMAVLMEREAARGDIWLAAEWVDWCRTQANNSF